MDEHEACIPSRFRGDPPAPRFYDERNEYIIDHAVKLFLEEQEEMQARENAARALIDEEAQEHEELAAVEVPIG